MSSREQLIKEEMEHIKEEIAEVEAKLAVAEEKDAENLIVVRTELITTLQRRLDTLQSSLLKPTGTFAKMSHRIRPRLLCGFYDVFTGYLCFS
ncbi:hypothetical protein BVRB_039710 [Beta vulgaris subsp. vulgaris]|uniref:Uncharacterized protein n=1 Tax=Beta vulgaris subsp. vulgaris TaxID=3555 RepID=A0A0J7YNB1_BETVV|nr:hypothetical protein BVRB_039710 [Beta vulgaris subsp. vulgaris]